MFFENNLFTISYNVDKDSKTGFISVRKEKTGLFYANLTVLMSSKENAVDFLTKQVVKGAVFLQASSRPDLRTSLQKHKFNSNNSNMASNEGKHIKSKRTIKGHM